MFFAIVAILLLICCVKKKHEQRAIVAFNESETTAPSKFVELNVPSQSVGIHRQVPVLCYHNITDNQNSGITINRNLFESHIKSLSDSIYNSISPDDVYTYLSMGKELPAKPIIISFDDTGLHIILLLLPCWSVMGLKAFFLL